MSRDAWKRFGKGGYKHYRVIDTGYKYNMTDIQVALGVHQLKKIDDNWKKESLFGNNISPNLKNFL